MKPCKQDDEGRVLWNGGQKERVKRRENYGLLIRQVVGGGARPFFVCK